MRVDLTALVGFSFISTEIQIPANKQIHSNDASELRFPGSC
nr:MAG TPA: hypothetical protein [Caudoviricetes sp.]